jgi:hypothetical protein
LANKDVLGMLRPDFIAHVEAQLLPLLRAGDVPAALSKYRRLAGDPSQLEAAEVVEAIAKRNGIAIEVEKPKVSIVPCVLVLALVAALLGGSAYLLYRFFR